MTKKRNKWLKTGVPIYRIMLEIPLELGERLAAMAGETGQSRSGILKLAVRQHLDEWDPTGEKRDFKVSDSELAQRWREQEAAKKLLPQVPRVPQRDPFADTTGIRVTADGRRYTAGGARLPSAKMAAAMAQAQADASSDVMSRALVFRKANPELSLPEAVAAIRKLDAETVIRIVPEIGYQHDGVQSPVPMGPPVDPRIYTTVVDAAVPPGELETSTNTAEIINIGQVVAEELDRVGMKVCPGKYIGQGNPDDDSMLETPTIRLSHFFPENTPSFEIAARELRELQEKRKNYMRMAVMLPKNQREIYLRETNARLAEVGQPPITSEDLAAARRQKKWSVNVMAPVEFGPRMQETIKHQVAAEKMVPTAAEKVIESGALDPSGAPVELDDARADAEKLEQAIEAGVVDTMPERSDVFARLFGGAK